MPWEPNGRAGRSEIEQEPPMKLPGPDHPIALEPSRRRVQATFDNHVIADTDDALIVREADYPPVVYFPIDDVEMSFLAKTDRATTCPYKGQASYWSIYMDGRLAENSVWAYEDPYPAMAALRGRMAFYPNVVEVYEVDENRTEA
jgi:uncharacterized protein (DUF427 family)